MITIKYSIARRLHKIISTSRCDGRKRPDKGTYYEEVSADGSS